MNLPKTSILLADDDADDCHFFSEALLKSGLATQLTVVHDGEQLMQLLTHVSKLPDVLFIDINMPIKDGFECLEEIKRTEKLATLPVIVLSTSTYEEDADLVYRLGARYYISKPTTISQLQQVIKLALLNLAKGSTQQPKRENFVIKTDRKAIPEKK